MGKVTYGSSWGRVRKSTAAKEATRTARPIEDVVRKLKRGDEKAAGEDYREKALAIYGLVCAHCGREFDAKNRHLLTVHHLDGNHHNNPPDGSNWINLCVYCHEDIHSRGLLGEYFAGVAGKREAQVVYDGGSTTALGSLAEKFKQAAAAKEKRKK